MTRRSHKIAVVVLFVLVLIAAIVALSRSAAAQDIAAQPVPKSEDCPSDAEMFKAAEHYAQYCSRCHLAEKLAADIQRIEDRERAKTDLAAFLAHHGSCSAEIDKAIADYLLNLVPTG
jgi:cytochrome c553